MSELGVTVITTDYYGHGNLAGCELWGAWIIDHVNTPPKLNRSSTQQGASHREYLSLKRSINISTIVSYRLQCFGELSGHFKIWCAYEHEHAEVIRLNIYFCRKWMVVFTVVRRAGCEFNVSRVYDLCSLFAGRGVKTRTEVAEVELRSQQWQLCTNHSPALLLW